MQHRGGSSQQHAHDNTTTTAVNQPPRRIHTARSGLPLLPPSPPGTTRHVSLLAPLHSPRARARRRRRHTRPVTRARAFRPLARSLCSNLLLRARTLRSHNHHISTPDAGEQSRHCCITLSLDVSRAHCLVCAEPKFAFVGVLLLLPLSLVTVAETLHRSCVSYLCLPPPWRPRRTTTTGAASK